MYQALGILNVVLLIIITSPYWVKKLNKHLLHLKGPGYNKLMKTLRTIHKPLGVILALNAIFHGYLALGTLRLHTGSLAWIMILITVALGIGFKIKKKPVVFKWHKRAALTVVILVIIHRLFPNALDYLLNIVS